MSYLSVAGHRAMALDARRNAAYSAALRQTIGPDSVVLDLGAGTGIHGLMAAKLGAKRVYLVEAEDVLVVAEEIARANGLDEAVRFVRGRIESVELPERVDVIVSVLTGNFLLTEDLLPALFHARRYMLKPGGQLIPSAATMEAAPVSAPALHAKEIAGWSALQEGIDLSAARPYAANTVFYRADTWRDLTYLAEPVALHTLDFYKDDYNTVHADAAYDIAESGLCHGWLGWFRMKLGDQWLSTSPREDTLHWSPAFLPLDPPMAFKKGEQVRLTLDRPPFGDWTWRVQSASGTQRHSTLLSVPMTASTLEKAALDYTPSLNADGHVLAELLSWCDGSAGVDAIACRLQDRYPERHKTHAEALSFVQQIIKRYA